jgi:hypothetical protein
VHGPPLQQERAGPPLGGAHHAGRAAALNLSPDGGVGGCGVGGCVVGVGGCGLGLGGCGIGGTGGAGSPLAGGASAFAQGGAGGGCLPTGGRHHALGGRVDGRVRSNGPWGAVAMAETHTKSVNSIYRANSIYRGVRSTRQKIVEGQTKATKWEARITQDGRDYHLGVFASEQQAAQAYDEAAVRLKGPAAALNLGPGGGVGGCGVGGCVVGVGGCGLGLGGCGIGGTGGAGSPLAGGASAFAQGGAGGGCLPTGGGCLPTGGSNGPWGAVEMAETHTKSVNSIYRGVRSTRQKIVEGQTKTTKWEARISSNNVRRHLGIFGTELEAAQAFDEAAIVLKGPQAPLNLSGAHRIVPGGPLVDPLFAALNGPGGYGGSEYAQLSAPSPLSAESAAGSAAAKAPPAKRQRRAAEESDGGGGGGQELKQCLAIVKQCEANENCWIFSEPVSDLDAPGYSDVVSKPMDLGTVQRKLKLSQYDGHEAFAADMRLVWANCKEYNENGSDVWAMADELESLFEALFGEARLAWAESGAGASGDAAALTAMGSRFQVSADDQSADL